MWQILEHPPQPWGECSLCKKHDCGEVQTDEGIKHQWVQTQIEIEPNLLDPNHRRNNQVVIGYKCFKNISDNLGITKEIVEKPVVTEPTDEHILTYIRRTIERQPVTSGEDPLQANIDMINSMTRDQLKAYLAEQKVEFVPQWGDDKLKEAALQHIKGAIAT